MYKDRYVILNGMSFSDVAMRIILYKSNVVLNLSRFVVSMVHYSATINVSNNIVLT